MRKKSRSRAVAHSAQCSHTKVPITSPFTSRISTQYPTPNTKICVLHRISFRSSTGDLPTCRGLYGIYGYLAYRAQVLNRSVWRGLPRVSVFVCLGAERNSVPHEPHVCAPRRPEAGPDPAAAAPRVLSRLRPPEPQADHDLPVRPGPGRRAPAFDRRAGRRAEGPVCRRQRHDRLRHFLSRGGHRVLRQWSRAVSHQTGELDACWRAAAQVRAERHRGGACQGERCATQGGSRGATARCHPEKLFP